jgi:ABC-2 type transport system permease protein
VTLVLRHLRAAALELLRYPAFSVPTTVFPALLFLLFAAPNVGRDAAVVTAGFAAMAALSVALFQFGVGIAAERASEWEAFLTARVLCGLLFAAASCAAVIAAAVATTSVSMSAAAWGSLLVALLCGAVPFAFMGIALGYWVRPRAALPIANLVFLPLVYVGGLWTGPHSLPSSLAGASPYLPTRQWGDWLWHSLGGDPWRPRAMALLALYGGLFALLAAWGYRRDEGERFA